MKKANPTEVDSEAMNGIVKQLPLKPRKHSTAPPLDGPAATDPLNVVGLFAGIGGIELGLSRSEHEAKLLCEIDVAANEVLDAHFQGIQRQNDVCEMTSLPRGTDLVAAGFPCQDLSQAGKTVGITGARSGLVGEVFRLIAKTKVEWVLLENVSFMLQLGRGRALDYVISELENLGYRWAYRVANSRAFGVPQRRERVYLLASRNNDPRSVLFVDDQPEPVDTRTFREVACGFYWTEGLRGLGWAVDSVPTLKGGSTIGIPSPPAIILPDGYIGTPDIRDVERMQGFDRDWTKPAERVSKRSVRWKLVGNAVTVDAAAWIGKRLRRHGEYDATGDVALTHGSRWPAAAWGSAGGGRHVADLGKWPIRAASKSLQDFLEYDLKPLSEKATAGFYSRALQAKLRFPDQFLAAVAAHLAKVGEQPLRAII